MSISLCNFVQRDYMKLNKKKAVYTQTHTDERTGEVTISRQIVKQVASRESFIMMYLDDIGKLYTLTHAEHRLLVTLSKYVEYNTNEFYLNVKRKEELVEITGLKYNTISQGLTRLVKKNLLLRVSNSTFQMNPNIMFKGEDLQRAKYIEITERYEICPECGEPEYEEKRNLKNNNNGKV